jgi:hypothetical protein
VQLSCPRATRQRSSGHPVARYGLLFSVAFYLDSIASATCVMNRARRAISRGAFPRIDGSGIGAAGLRRHRAIRGRASRALSRAWLNVAQEPKFFGQSCPERLSVFSMWFGREPPRPLRSCYATDLVRRCDRPLCSCWMRRPVDRREINLMARSRHPEDQGKSYPPAAPSTIRAHLWRDDLPSPLSKRSHAASSPVRRRRLGALPESVAPARNCPAGAPSRKNWLPS